MRPNVFLGTTSKIDPRITGRIYLVLYLFYFGTVVVVGPNFILGTTGGKKKNYLSYIQNMRDSIFRDDYSTHINRIPFKTGRDESMSNQLFEACDFNII